MSKDEIGELEALLERATPGPWEAEIHQHEAAISANGKGQDHIVSTWSDDLCGDLPMEANAALIVALRNHAPTLIARMRAAEAERDTAIREMSSYARQAGEWQGRYEGSEAAGAVEGWRDRAQAAEARVAALEEGLRNGCRSMGTAEWFEWKVRSEALLSESNHDQ
jgi:hypothetical protein